MMPRVRRLPNVFRPSQLVRPSACQACSVSQSSSRGGTPLELPSQLVRPSACQACSVSLSSSRGPSPVELPSGGEEGAGCGEPRGHPGAERSEGWSDRCHHEDEQERVFDHACPPRVAMERPKAPSLLLHAAPSAGGGASCQKRAEGSLE